jgi:threonine/homoserine/homoserine lactone efflux protein
MFDHPGPFFGVTAAVIVIPGPDTALTIRNTVFGGRKGGIFTAAGVSTGQAAWALAAAAGVAALLEGAEPVYMAIRIAGAAYLLFLGTQAILVGVRRTSNLAAVEAAVIATRLPPPVALRQGLISNLTNPKMAIFFTSLLPQFVPRGGLIFISLLALGLLFSMMTLVWLTAYVFLVATTGDFLKRPGVRRTLEILTGGALVGLALQIGWELA